MRLPLLCTALAAGLLAACQPVRPPAPDETTAPAPAAVPADDNLNAVLWVQRSAEYRAAAAQTYRAATDHLDAALRQADWDALVPEERGNAARGLKPAVILDIDETVLDNSPYQARLVRDGAEYSDPTWDAWVEERKARAVPGVVEFARAANARGVTLVYISNRAVHLKDATLANLRAEGLPVADESVFLGLGTVVPGCEQDGSEKDCRRQLAGRTYRVLMQFGDQLGDFARIHDNSPAGRQALLDTYDGWFGQRWWMLPNPTYGSWEPALFDNDWRQPREARRAAKRAALEVAP
ncbi:5'-nucleotidase, lipoprotein e(P4) family [Pseudoxanthomonas sp. 10H]|uniref:5'-nucleotidase, lipoprotein e(P4) family n=1 Tax=Pseudoxanthomonas sp. 10H TaxID=3242729 RepID=UPI0035565901